MSAIQVKRGTTESWKWGSELVDFGRLSISKRDSCETCYKNTIELTVGGPSKNKPLCNIAGVEPDSNGKVPGIEIITRDEFEEIYKNNSLFRIQVHVESVDGTDLASKEVGFNLLRVYIDDGSSTSLVTNTTNTYDGTMNAAAGDFQIFLLYEGELEDPYKIRLSLSIKGNMSPEGLMPGQLGCELDDDGNTLLKVGPHSLSKKQTTWSDIPYVGQVLPKCMYGSQDDMNGIVSPKKGQLFFVRVT